VNRSALNSAVVGSGNTPAWTLLSAHGIVQAVGDLSVSLTKRVSATAQVVAGGACTAMHVIASRMTALVAAAGSLTVQRLIPLDVSAMAFVGASVDLRPMRVRVVGGTGLAIADGSLTPKIMRGLSGSGVVVADGYCLAIDIYTGPAPAERTSYLDGGDRTSYLTR
jgi:hypothetical protein